VNLPFDVKISFARISPIVSEFVSTRVKNFSRSRIIGLGIVSGHSVDSVG